MDAGPSHQQQQLHQKNVGIDINSAKFAKQSDNIIYIALQHGNIIQYISQNNIDFEACFINSFGPPVSIQYLVKRKAIKV